MLAGRLAALRCRSGSSSQPPFSIRHSSPRSQDEASSQGRHQTQTAPTARSTVTAIIGHAQLTREALQKCCCRAWSNHKEHSSLR